MERSSNFIVFASDENICSVCDRILDRTKGNWKIREEKFIWQRIYILGIIMHWKGVVNMKKIGLILAGAIAGSIMTGGVVMAANDKAILGTSVFELNGQVVGSAPKIAFGGTTYVQLNEIIKALAAAGIKSKWNGSTNPGTFSMTESTASTTTASSAPPSNGVKVSTQLPYTFKANDGLEVVVNSVSSNASGVTLGVTFANEGQTAGQDVYAAMMQTSLSDGGPAVNLVSDADIDTSSPNFTVYNSLNTGQSVQDTLTFGPLMSGATQFTWYFQDFDGNTQKITFNLN